MKIKRETHYWVEFFIERASWDSESIYKSVPSALSPLTTSIHTKTTVCREKKFVCIGGKYGGQRKSETQLQNESYVGFNRASGSPRYTQRGPRRVNTKIWVHSSFGI